MYRTTEPRVRFRLILWQKVDSFFHLKCQDLRARDARRMRAYLPLTAERERPRRMAMSTHGVPRLCFLSSSSVSLLYTGHTIRSKSSFVSPFSTLLPRKEMRCDTILTDQGLPQRPVCWSLTQTSHGVQYSEFIPNVGCFYQ